MNEGALANIAIILRLPLNRELIYVCLIILKSKPVMVILTAYNFVVFLLWEFFIESFSHCCHSKLKNNFFVSYTESVNMKDTVVHYGYCRLMSALC